MMREEIAYLVLYGWKTGVKCDKTADAIITALPDMIPDLVWADVTAMLESGCYYTAIPSQSGKSYVLDYVYRGGSFRIGYFPNQKAAKSAANAHHKAQVMTALGLGGA